MGDSEMLRRHAARWTGLALLITAVIIVPASEAAAVELIVDCSGQTPGAFTSITSAIDSLTGPPPTTGGWDYVLLKTDCIENVTITGGRRLQIRPMLGDGSLVRISAASTRNVVDVQGPGDVVLASLVLSNGSNGLSVTGNASVTTSGVSAEDNSSNGFWVDSGATLRMNNPGGAASRNGRYGVNLGLGASVYLSGTSMVIRDNALGGIRVDRGRIYAFTGLTVENNSGPGLVAYAGVAAIAGVFSASVFQGNHGGMFISEGSRATFVGSLVLRNNGTYGIYVEDGGHATFIIANAGVIVEGHTSVGVDLVTNSQASFHGPHRISLNGTASDPASAGIRVDGSSHAYFGDSNNPAVAGPAEIVDNVGPGIMVDFNSSIDARTAILRGNAGEGVRVLHNSVAYLGPDSRLEPNVGEPLTCDRTSLVVTDLVRRSHACREVEAPSGPRPQRPPQPN